MQARNEIVSIRRRRPGEERNLSVLLQAHEKGLVERGGKDEIRMKESLVLEEGGMEGCAAGMCCCCCYCVAWYRERADVKELCKHASKGHVVTAVDALHCTHACMMCIASEKRFFIPVAFCLSLTLLLSLSRRHVIIAS